MYSLVAKDQLLSSDDLSFVACAARESAEMEASSRSQRETAEARASAAKAGPDDRSGGGGRGAATGAEKHMAGDSSGVKSAVVAAAPSLADGRMDEYWKEVSLMVLVSVGEICPADADTVAGFAVGLLIQVMCR